MVNVESDELGGRESGKCGESKGEGGSSVPYPTCSSFYSLLVSLHSLMLARLRGQVNI